MTREGVYNKFFNEESWSIVNNDNKLLLEDFLLELKQNKKSQGTIYQYRCDLKGAFVYICEKLGNKSILDLTKKDFRKYSLYLTEDCGVSSARHNRIMSSLRSLLTFAENEDDYDYDNNVARKVKGLSKEPVREIFFLTNDQILKLKKELIKKGEYQKATLLMLAYDSAGRKNELAQVEKLSFYDKSKNNTNKVIGKRKKVFSLIYFDGTKECAELWLNQRGEDNIPSLFTINGKPASAENIYDWFMYMRRMLFELEGKEIDFNVHSLRHSSLENYSCGTHYVCKKLNMETGFPIEKLKLIANHTDISTTSGYLKDKSLDELENMFGIKIE